MTFQAAAYANENSDLEVYYFEEGSPYTLFTMGIISGRETNETVLKVYDVLFNKCVMQDKIENDPEVIFKNQEATTIANFPNKTMSLTDIKYAKMNGLFDYEYKQQLLDEWKW